MRLRKVPGEFYNGNCQHREKCSFVSKKFSLFKPWGAEFFSLAEKDNTAETYCATTICFLDASLLPFFSQRAKKPVPVSQLLKTLSKLTYTLEELRSSTLPEGVDPSHLETYLSTKDFVDLFEMSKEQFYELPPWKQQNLRKEKNLYWSFCCKERILKWSKRNSNHLFCFWPFLDICTVCDVYLKYISK